MLLILLALVHLLHVRPWEFLGLLAAVLFIILHIIFVILSRLDLEAVMVLSLIVRVCMHKELDLALPEHLSIIYVALVLVLFWCICRGVPLAPPVLPR